MTEEVNDVKKVDRAALRSAYNNALYNYLEAKDALIDHLEAEIARLKKLVAERDEQIKDIYAAFQGG